MKKYLYSTLVMFCLCSTLFAQVGELDPSFSDDGLLSWNVGGSHNNGHGIGVQSDGKIVITSTTTFSDTGFNDLDIAVVRLNEDGSIDSTFAENGVFHLANPIGVDIIYHLAILDNDEIMVAGGYATTEYDQDFILVKLTPDGALDLSFGVDGVSVHAIGLEEDYIHGLTFNNEGQILAAGISYADSVYEIRHVVSRFEANGAIDTSFGDNGNFVWNYGGIYNDTWNIDIAPDGNIITSGKSSPFGTNRLSVYKILEDGSSLDSTFAVNGEILAPFEGTAYGMTLHSNGNILLTGSSYGVNGSDLIILAFNQDGTPNTNFGQDGVFLIHPGTSAAGLNLIEQPDGKIIACGQSGELFGSTPQAFFSVRIDENGLLDTSWGAAGHVRTENGWMGWASDIALQADGKVLMTGVSAHEYNELQIVRYGNFIDADEDGSPLGEDCNDAVASIFPGNTETAYNGIDDDCDPATLDDDLDQDGFVLAEDCDDMNAAVSPDNVEIPYNGFDDDCDPITPDDDLDADGFALADDCDDNDFAINPDAEEIPNNGIDEDCDGMDLMVSANEEILAQQFNVYPNPTSHTVTIDFDQSEFSINLVKISDSYGRTVKTVFNESANGKLSINLGDFPKGLWLFTFLTNEGSFSKRVVKM